MSAELSAAVGFAVAGAASFAATPLAIRVARRADFYDHPREYRQHAAPTPFLGGSAVVGAFLLAAVALHVSGRLLVLLGCAVGIWLMGTIDDRVAVAPKWRLAVETGAALGLLAVGLGWNTYGGGGDIVLTVVWVVALINGFNLMDNLDGACGTVGCVSAAGIGTLAAIQGESTLAGLSFALAGACAAFLHWNLATPAKVFLGDGGSRPIGLLVAGLAMATGRHLDVGDANLLVGALMVGVVVLDTTLVSVSRLRRGIPLVTGGRDHLSHRLLLVLRSPRRVAAVLAMTQATLCALAIAGDRWGAEALALLALLAITLGVGAIVVLDTARFRPAGIAVRPRPLARGRAGAPSAPADPR
jgi:UDP-GlcNAc:undecaprenyl-phosphate/decaprenyl-phosphate GlcNAc-1-phosphate transferase